MAIAPNLRDDLIVEPGDQGPGSVVIFDPRTGHRHRLNATAALIARLLNGERQVDTIKEIVEQEFDNEFPAPAIQSFIDGLDERLLLVPDEGDTRLTVVSAQRDEELRAREGLFFVKKTNSSTSPEDVTVRSDLRYGCRSCGACCSNRYRVQLAKPDLERLESLDLRQLGLTFEDVVVEKIQTDNYGKPSIKHFLRRNDGRCIFLAEDRLCELHREFGMESKPAACQAYPFLPILTPEGGLIAFRPECSTQHLSARSGPRIADRIAPIWEQLDQTFYTGKLAIPDSFPLTAERQIEWDEYKDIEERWVQGIRDNGWREGLASIARDFFDDPMPNPAPVRALLKQVAFACVDNREAYQNMFNGLMPGGDPAEHFGAMLASVGVEVDDQLQEQMPARLHAMQIAMGRIDRKEQLGEQIQDYLLNFITSKWQFHSLSVLSGLGMMSLCVFGARRSAAWANAVLERPLSVGLFNEALLSWQLMMFNGDAVRCRLLVNSQDALESMPSLPAELY